MKLEVCYAKARAWIIYNRGDIGLTTFMFAFMTIVSWATIAKVESTTQYAID